FSCATTIHPPDLHYFPTRRSSDLMLPTTSPSTITLAALLRCTTTFTNLAPLMHNTMYGVDILNLLNFFYNLIQMICMVYENRHIDRKSTRLNSSHVKISYAVFCLK